MISGEYKEITKEKAAEISSLYEDAWKDPSIPQNQYELAVKPEILRYHQGAPCAPFSALVAALLELPPNTDTKYPTFLEVGASSGYYGEVLKIAGFKFKYEASDYSEHFKTLANKLYPETPFHVADARKLPFQNSSYDIVMSGCVMIHVLDYEAIIKETARITKKYAIFHRTPVNISERTTRFFTKMAYGIPCIEIHFQESEIMKLFLKYGLYAIAMKSVFENPNEDLAHRVYVLEKR